MRFPTDADFSKRLRLVRANKDQTQQDVANEIGTSRKQIYRWETGKSLPGPYSRRKLAQWAGEPEEILFKGLKKKGG